MDSPHKNVEKQEDKKEKRENKKDATKPEIMNEMTDVEYDNHPGGG